MTARPSKKHFTRDSPVFFQPRTLWVQFLSRLFSSNHVVPCFDREDWPHNNERGPKGDFLVTTWMGEALTGLPRASFRGSHCSSGPEAGAYAERMGRIAPIRLSLAQDVDAPFPLVHVCVTALVLVLRRCWWIGSRSASSAGSVGRRAGQSVRNGES